MSWEPDETTIQCTKTQPKEKKYLFEVSKRRFPWVLLFVLFTFIIVYVFPWFQLEA